MTIVKKGDRYYADIEIEPGPDGKRRRQPLGGHRTKKDAEDAVAKARVARTEGTLVATSRTDYGKWAAVREEAQRSEIRDSSVAIYANLRRNHLLPVLGRTPLQKITPALFRKATRREGLGLRTQRMLHQLLKSDLQAAVEEGLLAVSPGARVKPPSKKLAEDQAPSMMPYSAEEAAEVLCRIKGSRYYTYIATLGSVGARRSEWVALTWDRVDLTNKSALIDRSWHREGFGPTKTGKARTVELDDHTVDSSSPGGSSAGRRSYALGVRGTNDSMCSHMRTAGRGDQTR